MTKLHDEILELRNFGLSYNEIVMRLGCSKGTVAYYLGKDQKLKNLSRTRNRRNKISRYIKFLKDNKECMDCKQQFPPFILEFDHRPGETKLFNISSARSTRTTEEIDTEVAKCDLVCANCHRFRTWSRSVRSNYMW